MSQRKWPLWAGPALFALVIVGLAIVALVRDPVQLDPQSPEGRVQTYLQAIGDEDYERAFEILDSEVFEGCDSADTRWFSQEQFTATIEESTTDSGEVVVMVNMEFGSGGPFGGGWSNEETFHLVKRDGSWWITEDVWPYFYWECREDGF